jgi:hypothetical protein
MGLVGKRLGWGDEKLLVEILRTARSLRYLRIVEPDVELFAEADQY